MSNKIIRFVASAAPYFAGDVAGFDPAIADKYIARKLAVPHDPTQAAPAPVDTASTAGAPADKAAAGKTKAPKGTGKELVTSDDSADDQATASARKADADVVEIPENWMEQKWNDKRKLASSLTDSMIKNAADADAAIWLELEHRKRSKAGS